MSAPPWDTRRGWWYRSSLRSGLVRASRKLPAPVFDRLRAIVERRRDAQRARVLNALVPVGAHETPPCVLCGGRDVEPHLVYNGFKIVACRRDGLLFVSPRPIELGPYYDDRYYSNGFPNQYQDYGAFARRELVPRWEGRLVRMAETLGAPGRLLDVGCATGVFLELAKTRGWRGSGIELSAWAAGQARALGFEVLQGSLPNAKLESGAFDAVTLWDCVEHLQQPALVLREVWRLLKPGGMLILSTGAVEHRDPRRISKWYNPPWHLYYFSEATMRALLAESGFVSMSYQEEDRHVPEYVLMVVTARKAA